MSLYSGTEERTRDPILCDAYCDGRKASVAGVVIGAAVSAGGNPHTANTQEWLAWRRGHILYDAAGGNTVGDSCAESAKFNTPATTNANYATDTTGATHSFTPAAPGLPFEIQFGDGHSAENPPASTSAILHTYAASGTYTVRLVLMGKVWATYSIVITIVEP